jgi:hypothetical protein
MCINGSKVYGLVCNVNMETFGFGSYVLFTRLEGITLSTNVTSKKVAFVLWCESN